MKKIHTALLVFLLCVVAFEAVYIVRQSAGKPGKTAFPLAFPNLFGSVSSLSDGVEIREEEEKEEEQDVPVYEDTVKVLLLNPEGGPLHNNPSFSCEEEFTVTADTGESMTYPGGTVLEETSFWENGAGLVTIASVSGRGLKVCDNGVWSLEYEGVFHVRKQEAGSAIVNQVGIEEYIYGVLPSEMPDSYEYEAFKAQAVCARSYVYAKMQMTAYPEYDAQIDDTVMFQVYNKQKISETARQAVDETRGMVLVKDGVVAEPFYFSTSWGHTSDVGVWNLNQEDYTYLQPIWVALGGENRDFSKEEDFAQAVMGSEEEALEKECRYYRWQAEFSMNKNTEKVVEILKQRASMLPGTVRFLDKMNEEELDTTPDFGKIVAVSITKRSYAGAAQVVEIVFEHCKVTVQNEYTIRSLFGAMTTNITCQDGFVQEEAALLPSSYFVIASQSEESNGTVYGGGLGHGVGMSQNGANLLALNQYGYADILRFFYQDIEVMPLEELTGQLKENTQNEGSSH